MTAAQTRSVQEQRDVWGRNGGAFEIRIGGQGGFVAKDDTKINASGKGASQATGGSEERRGADSSNEKMCQKG